MLPPEELPPDPAPRFTPATPWIIDFSQVLTTSPDGVEKHYRTRAIDPKHRRKNGLSAEAVKAQSVRKPGNRERVGPPVKSMSPKQIRARARRAQAMLDADLSQLYKPIEEWDAEELARGRPRAKDGSWKGPKPEFVNRQFHEKIVKRFAEVVKMDMREQTVEALVVMKKVMLDDRVDARGRPITPSSTKLDAAKFLIEHVVGKPTQRTETDISIKLQSILGSAMLNPPADAYSQPELTQGYIEATVIEDDDDEEDDNDNHA